MSKKDKLKEKLKQLPNDFTWGELVTLLSSCGFEKIEGDGSRVKFFNKQRNKVQIAHKPHPKKIVKVYILKQVKVLLEEIGEI